MPSLRGDLAIAHCRYSTTGSTVWENAQPTFRLGPRRALAIGHNGNLVNTRELLGQLSGGRGRLPASTDTELLTALLADEPAADTVDALVRVLPRVRGAFSLVVLDERRVIGVRDPFGFRPLVLGRLPIGRRRRGATRDRGLWGDRRRAPAGASRSETAGLDIVGAEYVRDVEPGEIVVLEAGPRAALRPLRAGEPRAVRVRADLLRPARLVHGGPQPVRGPAADGRAARPRAPGGDRPRHARAGHRRRRPRPATPRRRGSRTARASSATATAAGRSSSRRQTMRQRGVTIKLNPLREVVRGKRLTVVDDSIVRGTTTKQIVALLRQGRRRRRSTSGSAPRRSTTPASTASTPRSRRS